VAEAADHLESRQIAVGNELLELTVPFVETPIVRVGLVVSAEVRIIEFILMDELIGRGGLDDAGCERIGDRLAMVPMLPGVLAIQP
jgi:hypothetical protein